MHSTNSYLYTIIERVRAYLDEADVDAKYNDDFIVRHTIAPAQVDVLARLNHTTGCQMILTHDITFVEDVTEYPLPPCIQTVYRLVVIDDNGTVLADMTPRNMFHPAGEGWALRGNPGAMSIKLSSPTLLGDTLQLWYSSNGDVQPHYGTGTLATANEVSTLTLDLTPTIGSIDRRPNAYAGQVLRLLPTSPSPIEERTIATSSFDGTNWTVTTNKPFEETDDGSILYEIAPAGSQSLYEAIACWSALKLGTARKIPESQFQRLTQQYRAALKSIGDNLTFVQGRTPHHMAKDTIDNTSIGVFGWNPLR